MTSSALSCIKRRGDVCWITEASNVERQLRIRWRETGVTIDGEPSGFGSDILEKSMPHILRGTFERTFHRDGLECVIVLPLERPL